MRKFRSIIIFNVSVILTCILGCRSDKSEQNKSKEQKEIVKELNYHLENGLKDLDHSFGIEQKFNNEVYLRSFAFYEKDINYYGLILELQDDIKQETISKYTFAVEGFASEQELNNLSDYTKKKSRKYEAWYAKPDLIKLNGHCYVILDVKTKLKHLEEIKFYLFDRNGYRGDLGNRILFYDYKIK